MSPLHVVLDTSVLTPAPRLDTPAFDALNFLAINGEVVIHVSDVAAREFGSQLEDVQTEAVNKIDKALKTMRRSIPSSAALPASVTAIFDMLPELRAQLRQASETGLPLWLANNHGHIHPIKPEHTVAVMDNYFTGGMPFAHRKNREDIPDAYIYESLKSDVPKPAHAVINDANLRGCAEALEGVSVYATLDDFVASPQVQALLADATTRTNVLAITDALVANPVAADLAVREQLVDQVAGQEIESAAIPDDNNEATVSMVGDAYAIAYDGGAARYYGQGVIRLPFAASVEAYADYYIFKADYYGLSDERRSRISISDWNDHYFSAEESFVVRVHGSIAVEVDPAALDSHLDEQAIGQMVLDAQVTIDAIEELEVIPTEHQ